MSGSGAVTRSVTASGFACSVTLGLIQSSYGPSVPHLASRFGITVAAAGLIVTVHFLGVITGVLGFGLLHARFVISHRLLLAALLMGAGTGVAAVAGTWLLLQVAIAFVGVGYGGLAVMLNPFFAASYGRRSPAMLSLMNAAFGVGSFVGPAVVATTGTHVVSFAAAAITSCACALALRRAPSMPVSGADELHDIAGGSTARLLIAFVVMLFFYVGIEAGIGAWETTNLVAMGSSAAFGAVATSFYWAAFTIGRVVTAPVAIRVAPERIMAAGLAVATALLIAIQLGTAPPVLFALVGFAIAPTFPVALVWLARLTPRSLSAAATAMMLGTSVGSAALPAVLGGLVGRGGARYVPSGLAVFSLACMGCLGGIVWKWGRPAEDQ